MGLLSNPSQTDALPPQPADPRLCALGFAAWEAALAEAEDPRRAAARAVSGRPGLGAAPIG